MEYVVGFLIALVVGLTGVGAGSITAPVLMLFFGLPPVESVGTALVFAAIIKVAVIPVYLARGQVHFRTLSLLCLGGIPGVIAGFFFLGLLNAHRQQSALFLILGLTIVVMAMMNVVRSLRQGKQVTRKDRPRWLPGIAAVIGAEVGFSSAGAGALGSVALLSLTSLTASQVVGTDMAFGLVTSIIGGGFHFGAGHYSATLLMQLIIGGLAGAFAGAGLSSVVPSRALRLALSVWLVLIGAQLCWRAVDSGIQTVHPNATVVR
jgi:uncharacterized membrane protein YfcA